MKNILFICALFLSLTQLAYAASVTTQESLLVTKVTQSGDFMPIVGPQPQPRPALETEIEALVKSSGCTNASDFEVTVHRTSSAQILFIKRIKPDLCRAMEHWTTVVLTTTDAVLVRTIYDGQGNTYMENPLHLANPLHVEDNTTN